MVLHEFRIGFKCLRGELESVRTADRADAPHFNIFRLLGVERDEVNTHSAFLARPTCLIRMVHTVKVTSLLMRFFGNLQRPAHRRQAFSRLPALRPTG
jgi:hypothetical protein